MLNFGVVGCGRIAKRHTDLLGRNQIAGARLAAVCDIRPDRAQALAASFGVPAFTDLQDMMRRCELDAVSVLTPSGVHAKNVLDMAPYGKHHSGEKALALTV